MPKNIATPAAGQQTVAPEFATIDHGHDLPKIAATPLFVFVFSPGRFMVMEGLLVPQLSTIPLAQGSNQIEMEKDGRPKVAKFQARLAEEGRTLVPFKWAPDGVSYIQRVETRKGDNTVHAHITVFEKAFAGATQTRTDTKAFATWLASLVESGKLPACPQQVAEDMLDKALKAHAAAVAEAQKLGSGRAQLRADQLARNVKAIQTHIGELEEAPGESVAPELDGPDELAAALAEAKAAKADAQKARAEAEKAQKEKAAAKAAATKAKKAQQAAEDALAASNGDES